MRYDGKRSQAWKRRGKTVVVFMVSTLLIISGLFAMGCTREESTSSDKTITIGWIPWDEDVAVTYLWKAILENEGYTVNLVQADAGPIFEGLSSGDIDLFLDTWLPTTHSDYWAQYGDNLEQLSVWYDDARLTWAVPAYVDIDSIDELAANGDLFNNRIIGIEPGAGLTRISREAVMPGYGLDDYTLVEGSTTAMLAELDRSITNETPVIVTLWHPHWAYNTYDLKDLEDPNGLLGAAEEIRSVARTGFSEEHSEVVEWLNNFSLSNEQLAELEDLVINDYGTGSESLAINEWLSSSKNQALVNEWLGK